MQSIFLVVIAFLFFLLSQASLAILVGHFRRVLALHYERFVHQWVIQILNFPDMQFATKLRAAE